MSGNHLCYMDCMALEPVPGLDPDREQVVADMVAQAASHNLVELAAVPMALASAAVPSQAVVDPSPVAADTVGVDKAVVVDKAVGADIQAVVADIQAAAADSQVAAADTQVAAAGTAAAVVLDVLAVVAPVAVPEPVPVLELELELEPACEAVLAFANQDRRFRSAPKSTLQQCQKSFQRSGLDKTKQLLRRRLLRTKSKLVR